jgi:hypothetical protein
MSISEVVETDQLSPLVPRVLDIAVPEICLKWSCCRGPLVGQGEAAGMPQHITFQFYLGRVCKSDHALWSADVHLGSQAVRIASRHSSALSLGPSSGPP